MNSNVSVWELGTESGESCLVRTEVLQKGLKIQGFRLKILTAEHLWTGSFDSDQIEEFSKSTNRHGEYLALVRETLCGERKHDMEFDFDVPLSTGRCSKLMWKELRGSSAKFKMGEMDIFKSMGESSVCYEILRECISEVGNLKQECMKVVDSKVTLAKERDDSLQMLKTAVKAKESLEKDLLPVFLALINSKKMKIAEILSGNDETAGATSSGVGAYAGNEIDEDGDTDGENEQIRLRREESQQGKNKIETGRGQSSLPEPVIVPKKRKRGAKMTAEAAGDATKQREASDEGDATVKRSRSGRRSGSDSASLLAKMS